MMSLISLMCLLKSISVGIGTSGRSTQKGVLLSARVEVVILELNQGVDLGGDVAAMVVFVIFIVSESEDEIEGAAGVMPVCDEVLGIINDVVAVKVVKFPREDIVEFNQRADEVVNELNVVVNVPLPVLVEFSQRGGDGSFAIVDVVWFAVPSSNREVAVRTRWRSASMCQILGGLFRRVSPPQM